jgi:hypothetical protein
MGKKQQVIQVRVTDEEFAVLTLFAHERRVSVSQIVREKLFAPDAQHANAATHTSAQPRTARGQAQGATSRAIVAPGRSGREMADVRMAPPATGACPHGKTVGSLCYKCDERFGYPRITAS